MIIIHGDNNIASYQYLSEIGTGPIYGANELTLTKLRQLTQPQDLFGNTGQVIIKDLFSTTKSKSKDACLKYLSENQELAIVLYEKKAIPAATLKKFSKSEIKLFKIENLIFKFLDILRPNNQTQIFQGYQKLLKNNTEPEYLFAMILRQIRLLIHAKSDPKSLSLPPYPAKLIISQASYYQLNKLLDMHHQLYKIDLGIKSGLLPGGLEMHLQHFLLSI